MYKEKLEAQDAMLEGRGFARPLVDTGLFPGAAKQMFKVGEETGTLDQQLDVATIYFDRELESRIKKFTAMFEPIMIVFVGLIVGFVAMALVSAMYGVLGSTKDRLITLGSAREDEVDEMLSDEDRHERAEGQEWSERHGRARPARSTPSSRHRTRRRRGTRRTARQDVPGSSQPRYMPSSGASRTSPSPMPPLLRV